MRGTTTKFSLILESISLNTSDNTIYLSFKTQCQGHYKRQQKDWIQSRSIFENPIEVKRQDQCSILKIGDNHLTFQSEIQGDTGISSVRLWSVRSNFNDMQNNLKENLPIINFLNFAFAESQVLYSSLKSEDLAISKWCWFIKESPEYLLECERHEFCSIVYKACTELY